MAPERLLLRQMLRQWRLSAAGSTVRGTSATAIYHRQYCHTTVEERERNCNNNNTNQWLILPPFTPAADGSSIGKMLCGEPPVDSTNMTALKWILKCCPNVPRSLVHKLFRLRQIRKYCSGEESKEKRPRRVGAKDLVGIGDRLLLPKSVDEKSSSTIAESRSFFNEKESAYVRGLELYKDAAIIVINKPPGLSVQGGCGINRSVDKLASKYLRYDCIESPRLVHRLDRDSSGVLVMGRTQLSATIMHSIFREKTFEASNDADSSKRILQKRYWALVIGSPRRQQGLISVPLAKVVVDNGKSERITLVDKNHFSAQHALTEYRVIASSSHGYTWLELSPLTGRKHQLRVHCAEVLGTPIVGDYKYGWQVHKKLGHHLDSVSDLRRDDKISEVRPHAFGLDLEAGSISDKRFSLHLHCKEMILPNISMALQLGNIISELDTARMESIKLDAPLPAHMQRSWDLLN